MNIIKNVTGVARTIINTGKRQFAKVSLVGTAVLAPVVAHAQTTGPDLSPVTSGMSDLKTAALTAGATVIAAGIALMGLKFGGKWVVRVFKGFSS